MTNMYGRNGHFTNHTHQKTQIEDIHNTQHHSDQPMQHVNKGAFTIEGHPHQVNLFYRTPPHEYYNNVFHNFNITTKNPDTSPHARGTIYEGNLLLSRMIEQSLIQAGLTSMETFDIIKK